MKPLALEVVRTPVKNNVVTITDASNESITNEGEAAESDNDECKATTTTTTTTTATKRTLLDESEDAVAHAYFDNKRSVLLEMKRAEDMEQVPKSTSSRRPATKREASEEEKKAQERTKKLMSNSNVADELANAGRCTHTHTHTQFAVPHAAHASCIRGLTDMRRSSTEHQDDAVPHDKVSVPDSLRRARKATGRERLCASGATAQGRFGEEQAQATSSSRGDHHR
jgi:hypothetical protein